MRTLYHLTPSRNVKSILQHGLRPSNTREQAFAIRSEETIGKIFLGTNPELCLSQFDYVFEDPGSYGDKPMMRIRKWSILKVNLPDDWPLHTVGPRSEYETEFYSTKPLPPEYISVLRDFSIRWDESTGWEIIP